jgi:adenylate kinase
MSARLLIVGPPGAGKGTQAARIAERFGIPTISTGDIFRKNIAEQTELGKQVKAIVDAGDYVPDSLTNALVTDRLSEADAAGGFLLDGYPRTTDQVRYLTELLGSHGHSLDAVIRLVADEDEIVRRLRQRALEQGRVDDSGKPSGTARRSTRGRPCRCSRCSASKGCSSRSTASAPSTRSPPASSRRSPAAVSPPPDPAASIRIGRSRPRSSSGFPGSKPATSSGSPRAECARHARLAEMRGMS